MHGYGFARQLWLIQKQTQTASLNIRATFHAKFGTPNKGYEQHSRHTNNTLPAKKANPATVECLLRNSNSNGNGKNNKSNINKTTNE